jgi:hypothetical protein
MADRRSKDGGGDIGVILLVLAVLGLILLTIAVYATPLILLIGILVYEIRAKRAPGDFALRAEEAEELSDVGGRFGAVIQRLEEIEQEGSDLKQNADGMYHRGSRLGVSLNNELEELLPEKDQLADRYIEIQQIPVDRLDKWIHLSSMRSALRWVAPAYIGIGIVLYLIDPAWMTGLSSFIGQYLFLHFRGANDMVFASALIAALASAVLLPIAYFIRRGALARATESTRQQLLEIPDGEDSPPASGDEDQESPDDEYEDEEYNGAADEDDEPEAAKPWYEILGVPPSASPREINVAYREHVKTCHPDLVAGLDPEFRELAEAKAKALNAAREEGLGRN